MQALQLKKFAKILNFGGGTECNAFDIFVVQSLLHAPDTNKFNFPSEVSTVTAL